MKEVVSSDIYKTIYSRRSVRKYSSEPVNDEHIERILSSACTAPSAHNTQPWRFFILKNKNSKYRFAKATADEYKQDLISDGLSNEKRNKIIERSINIFSNAPVLIVVCLSMKDFPRYSDRRRQDIERVLGVQSVSAAIQNMLLSAHLENLGACWRCAPAYAGESIKREFGLADDLEPIAVITLGHPAESPVLKKRKPLEDVIITVD